MKGGSSVENNTEDDDLPQEPPILERNNGTVLTSQETADLRRIGQENTPEYDSIGGRRRRKSRRKCRKSRRKCRKSRRKCRKSRRRRTRRRRH